MGMFGGQEHGCTPFGDIISGQCCEVFCVVLAGYCFRTVPELHAGFRQANKEFEVLVAINLEGFIESTDLEENISTNGEVPAIEVAELEFVPWLTQILEMVIKF